jgi:hypothetical protein
MRAMIPSMRAVSLLVIAAVLGSASNAQDLVVHSGETVTLEEPTVFLPPVSLGQLTYDTIIVESGGVLRFQPTPSGVRLEARRGILVYGLIDLSGENARPIRIFNSALLQEVGGVGGPGGSRGGTGNPTPGQSSPKGGDGLNPNDGAVNSFGGAGGETSYGFFSPNWAAGGGGARLAADQPVTAAPLSPLNLGLVATSGFDGWLLGHGAISGQSPPRGGAAGPSVFLDANPLNDFWGRELDPLTGTILVGELVTPRGGRGGGAGGDCVLSTSFPSVPWTAFNNLKGAGAGGGGGLGAIVTPRLNIVGDGSIRSNGGDGAVHPITNTNIKGGGSGGGSGGMLLLQVTTLDLRMANPRCITALGGRGGTGAFGAHDAMSAGGNGGPGILQLHMVNGPSGILLPAGKTLFDMTSPLAHVLLPEPGL